MPETPQPPSQTLRERIQECLDSDGSKTWRSELLEECLAALAAQEASPVEPEYGAGLQEERRQRAEASPQPDLARAAEAEEEGWIRIAAQNAKDANAREGEIARVLRRINECCCYTQEDASLENREEMLQAIGILARDALAACRQEQP